ncbi:helix-turn-helix domain-containing protein [Chryseobacterium gallinarum]|uniref:helix-turn-helix domain-containing protein n=1 Tax=Chryseobacterium gallinarum TaxID=1324352 RepID=UPI0009E4042D|nr:helix-turn-helix domain-containing protein [Chryseobacterium gallinarum]
MKGILSPIPKLNNIATMTLLADTNKTITYIADNLGFADSQSLYHFFKRSTGCTQTQYRNQLLGKL